MKKIAKLSLLLLISLAGCSLNNGSVNNEISSQYISYIENFDLSNNENISVEENDLSQELLDAGFSKKIKVTIDNSVLGFVYDGKVLGRNGDINFQISFKDGKYNTFKVIGDHCENQGFPGADLLNTLNDKLNGKEASTYTDASQFYNNKDFIAGATAQSTTYLFPAIIFAANDYLNSI